MMIIMAIEMLKIIVIMIMIKIYQKAAIKMMPMMCMCLKFR